LATSSSLLALLSQGMQSIDQWKKHALAN